MALQRPLKEGNVRTYQEKVALNFKDILASEADADHDTMYAAWNGALGGDLTGTLPNPTVTAAAKSKWSDSGTVLTPVATPRDLTLAGVINLPAKGKITAGVNFIDVGSNLDSGYPNYDQSTNGWFMRINRDADYFSVWRRSPATTNLVNLLTLDNAGNLTASGSTAKLSTGNQATRLFSPGAVSANTSYTGTWVRDDTSKPGWLSRLDPIADNFTVGRDLGGGPGTLLTIDNGGNLIIVGAVGQKASGTTWANPSDPRLKDDVAPYAAGLAEVCQLAPISYRLKADPTRECYGFDASAVREVFPECVSTTRMKLDPADEEETDDVLVFDMNPILVALVNAVRELAAKVAP